MTPTTVFSLCLALILFLSPPRALLTSLVVMIAFQDAAVFRVGGTAVNVGWFFVLLTAVRCTISTSRPSKGELEQSILAIAPLLVLFIYGIAAILISLCLFYEAFLTMPGSARFVLTSAQLYRPAPEQFRQNVYMAVTLVCILAITIHMARQSTTAISQSVNEMFRYGGLFACAVMFWNFFSVRFGVPFPGDFFHSDGTTAAWQQQLAGVHRISGSFAEPSAVAGLLVPILFFAGTHSILARDYVSLLTAAACIASLLLSTSTTAYLMLALFFAYFTLALGLSLVRRGGGSRSYVFVTSGLLALAGLTAFSHLMANFDFYRELIHFTLNKQESYSYAMRSAANTLAAEIFVATFGLGIGLGAHRASGLIYNVMAAFGVVGLLCFGVYIAVHLQKACRTARLAPELSATVWPAFAAAISGLAVAAVSAGEVTSFSYYLPFAIVSACSISVLRRRSSIAPVSEPEPEPPSVHHRPVGSRSIGIATSSRRQPLRRAVNARAAHSRPSW